ncbi:hypothetical protein [Pseudomonas sp. AM8]|uniref:hypothetical protein n=1 Tax=Pseudomonas sp. AM8 TaxID=2983368 RepID=UPI002E810DEA|nr:hypothetical protein [Pseudomonas sp. AM8]
MIEPKQPTSTPVLRQVLGWVLVLPLLVALVRLPYPLGLGLALGSIAASVYGVVFARRHASRGVTVFAAIVTLFNLISLVAIGEASVIMGLYRISWFYWYPYYSNWVYWNVQGQ